jgi:hypothetical protein
LSSQHCNSNGAVVALAPAVNPRAQELSEALIDICSSTAAGSKASPTTKQEIEELVRTCSGWFKSRTVQCSAESLLCTAASAATIVASKWASSCVQHRKALPQLSFKQQQ